ncbi:MAG TPA: folate-binding protein YgfZ [Minicystis sp.]|nr:folate-binding protein YgfZ [Minicystis sp.]
MIDVAASRSAAERALLVVPRPELGTVTVTGRDRVAWLNGLVTCELAKLGPGAGAYGLAVSKTGKVLAELFVLASAERLVVAARRDRIAALVEHFDKHLVMEDVELADASDALAWLFTIGPAGDEALARARARGAEAARVDWTGKGDAVAIAVNAGDADALVAELAAIPGACVAVPEALPTLEVLWGLPRFGVDYGEENVPHEASLEKLAVSFSKGCYLGQEAVFMLEARGHAKKHLARLDVEGAEPPERGAAVTLPDGTAVGEVTRAVSVDGGAVALAYVKHKHAQPGAALAVGGRAARLVDLAARPATR